MGRTGRSSEGCFQVIIKTVNLPSPALLPRVDVALVQDLGATGTAAERYLFVPAQINKLMGRAGKGVSENTLTRLLNAAKEKGHRVTVTTNPFLMRDLREAKVVEPSTTGIKLATPAAMKHALDAVGLQPVGQELVRLASSARLSSPGAQGGEQQPRVLRQAAVGAQRQGMPRGKKR